MEKWSRELTNQFNNYCNSFNGLSVEDQRNFNIKKAHSFRVADYSVLLAEKLEMNNEAKRLVYFIGLFHDIGRFSQLKEFGTFDDSKSIDHAEYSLKVLKQTGILALMDSESEGIVQSAIFNHNKIKITEKLSDSELQYARIIRDADKLDILKVLSDFYSSRNVFPNHTLTWELPKGWDVSKTVRKEILAGKLVSKKNVASEIDIKVMQMSWVYDLNFRTSFEYLLRERFLENIYSSLPKNDLIIGIFKQVKMYAGNKLFV